MYCIKCIKRLFSKEEKEYSFKKKDNDNEEFYKVYRPIDINTSKPLTEKELSETSMFKKINEWSNDE